MKNKCSPAELEDFAEALVAELAKENKPVYAFRRKGLDDFCTCDKRRFDELSQKTTLFEVRVFYTFPPTAEQIANETAWQPIETAPVLSNVLAARLDYGQVCWVVDARKSKVGFWSTINGRAVNEPTHWMPLPTPPQRSMEGDVRC